MEYDAETKVIEVPADASQINELLDQARHHDLILRAADGTEYLLTKEDDFEQEIVLTRQNKELMALLDERRKEPATISLDQVRRELGLE